MEGKRTAMNAEVCSVCGRWDGWAGYHNDVVEKLRECGLARACVIHHGSLGLNVQRREEGRKGGREEERKRVN